MQSKSSKGANTASAHVLEAQRLRARQQVVAKIDSDLHSIDELVFVIATQASGEDSFETQAQNRRIVSRVSNDNKSRLSTLRTAISNDDVGNVTVEDITIAALLATANKHIAPKTSQVQQLSTIDEIHYTIDLKVQELKSAEEIDMTSLEFLQSAKQIMISERYNFLDLTVIRDSLASWMDQADILQALLLKGPQASDSSIAPTL